MLEVAKQAPQYEAIKAAHRALSRAEGKLRCNRTHYALNGKGVPRRQSHWCRSWNQKPYHRTTKARRSAAAAIAAATAYHSDDALAPDQTRVSGRRQQEEMPSPWELDHARLLSPRQVRTKGPARMSCHIMSYRVNVVSCHVHVMPCQGSRGSCKSERTERVGGGMWLVLLCPLLAPRGGVDETVVSVVLADGGERCRMCKTKNGVVEDSDAKIVCDPVWVV